MTVNGHRPGRMARKPSRAASTGDARRPHDVWEVEAEGLAEGLEASGRAAVVLNEAGAVVYRTASMRLLVGRDFSITGGRLHGLDSVSETAFRDIRDWAAGETQAGAAGFLIHRASPNNKPLIAVPVRRIESAGDTGAARSVVAFIDLSRANPSPTEHLRALFRLTESEAAIAAHIAAGLTVVEIADQRGVARATVRGQLKSIFRKLDLKRQSDIVRLVDRIGWTPPHRPRRGASR
jgi:DNA-binding CsgD family transcriptional regulator